MQEKSKKALAWNLCNRCDCPESDEDCVRSEVGSEDFIELGRITVVEIQCI